MPGSAQAAWGERGSKTLSASWGNDEAPEERCVPLKGEFTQ